MQDLKEGFPKFARFLDHRRTTVPDEEWEDQILPAASLAEIATIEAQLSVALPASYKRFLEITRGVLFYGGDLQMDEGHPFVHDFPSWDSLTWRQTVDVTKRGKWPPPGQGLLCFADYCLDGDGDQVLFDVRGGLVDGEYPVVYYNHDRAEVRTLAPSFREWLERLGEDYARRR
jgi:cell wall assembly regulator SMI1